MIVGRAATCFRSCTPFGPRFVGALNCTAECGLVWAAGCGCSGCVPVSVCARHCQCGGLPAAGVGCCVCAGWSAHGPSISSTAWADAALRAGLRNHGSSIPVMNVLPEGSHTLAILVSTQMNWNAGAHGAEWGHIPAGGFDHFCRNILAAGLP